MYLEIARSPENYAINSSTLRFSAYWFTPSPLPPWGDENLRATFTAGNGESSAARRFPAKRRERLGIFRDQLSRSPFGELSPSLYSLGGRHPRQRGRGQQEDPEQLWMTLRVRPYIRTRDIIRIYTLRSKLSRDQAGWGRDAAQITRARKAGEVVARGRQHPVSIAQRVLNTGGCLETDLALPHLQLDFADRQRRG